MELISKINLMCASCVRCSKMHWMIEVGSESVYSVST